ncbi:MAG: hypothetical protein KME29_10845 [Calothrix sp. FI2-JRJ7]|nr:hypothetical protein [Calothrix sp. FI2-JRJ7]
MLYISLDAGHFRNLAGVVWGQCCNESRGNLGIYGTGSEESEESGNKNLLAAISIA